jgi:uncharacterized protein YggL (DUF469 family)
MGMKYQAMKKRLRKKRHRGEFRQFGFTIGLKFGRIPATSEFDAFVDAFIGQAIEGNGLVFGGGGSPQSDWRGVVQQDHRYKSSSPADQTAVSEWLYGRPEVCSVRISPMWDLWNSSDPFETTLNR